MVRNFVEVHQTSSVQSFIASAEMSSHRHLLLVATGQSRPDLILNARIRCDIPIALVLLWSGSKLCLALAKLREIIADRAIAIV